VYLAVVKAAGYDALGLRVFDNRRLLRCALPAHHHLVPLEHRLVRERRGESFVEIDHHFRDAAFGGRYTALVTSEPELLAQRRLHALAV